MGYNKADLAKNKDAMLVPRIVAAIIDGVLIGVVAGIISLILGAIWYVLAIVGSLVGAGLYLIRDSLLDGQSPGKKVMGLRAVNYATGKRITQDESIKRNLLGAAGFVTQAVGYLPVIGWLLSIPVGLAFLGAGLYDVWIWWNDREGRRYMDTFAGTVVMSDAPLPVKDEVEEEVAQ